MALLPSARSGARESELPELLLTTAQFLEHTSRRRKNLVGQRRIGLHHGARNDNRSDRCGGYRQRPLAVARPHLRFTYMTFEIIGEFCEPMGERAADFLPLTRDLATGGGHRAARYEPVAVALSDIPV